jgi:transposase-like protein
MRHLGIKPKIKRQVLQLYLKKLGFRSIGRFLNCNHVAVYNWIKAHGESIEPLQFEKEVVELDEIHTYIDSKKLLLDLDYC